MGVATAQADRLNKVTKRLAKSKSYKVRISAALTLAKSNDPRAIKALTRALEKDKDNTVRRVAATSLGTQLQKGTGKKERGKAIKALKKAAKKDRDSRVRSSASVALTKIQNGSSSSSATASRGRGSRGLVVGVAVPKTQSRSLPRKASLELQKTVTTVLSKNHPGGVLVSSGLPNKRQLQKSGKRGFTVVPEISELKLRKKGAKVQIRCAVKMRLSPYSASEGEKWVANDTAMVAGSGMVESSSSKSAISSSSLHCLTAVMEQVTKSQVIPFLAKRTR